MPFLFAWVGEESKGRSQTITAQKHTLAHKHTNYFLISKCLYLTFMLYSHEQQHIHIHMHAE